MHRGFCVSNTVEIFHIICGQGGSVMRRCFGTVVVVLFSAVLAVAQGGSGDKGGGPDDHNDRAPVQSGHGGIKPVAPTTGGTTACLAVFETFGRRGGHY